MLTIVLAIVIALIIIAALPSVFAGLAWLIFAIWKGIRNRPGAAILAAILWALILIWSLRSLGGV